MCGRRSSKGIDIRLTLLALDYLKRIKSLGFRQKQDPNFALVGTIKGGTSLTIEGAIEDGRRQDAFDYESVVNQVPPHFDSSGIEWISRTQLSFSVSTCAVRRLCERGLHESCNKE